MYKKILVLTILILNLSDCFAQGFNKLLGGTGAEVFNTVTTTADGGYLAVGTSNTWGSGNNDAVIVKFSSSGTIVWSKLYGVAGSNEEGWEIATTGTSNYMIGGYTTVPGSDNTEIVLWEIDANGQIIWSRTYGTSINDYIRSIVRTPDGGYIISGDSWVSSGGVNDVKTGDYFMIKLDVNRNISWQKRFYYSPYVSPGNLGNGDIASMIIPASDGGYYFTGHSYYGQNYDQVVVKFNSAGTEVWSKRTGRNDEDALVDIKEMANGEIVVAGCLRPTIQFPPTGYTRPSLMRLTSTGTIVWAKEYSTGTNEDGRAYGFGQASNGDFVISGYATPTVSRQLSFIRTDNAGTLLNTRVYGRLVGGYINVGNSIVQNSTGDFVIVGHANYAGAGGTDAHILKTNSAGDINNDIPCTVANFVEQNTTFTINQAAGLGYVTGTFSTGTPTLVATNFTVVPKEFPKCNLDVCEINPISYSGLPTFICPNSPPVTLAGNQTSGTYQAISATGTTNLASNILDPVSFNGGEYTVKYTSTSVPAGCPNNISKKTVIFNKPVYIDRVISSSSTTYSDTWPLDYTNVNGLTKIQRTDLDGSGAMEVANATKGIWHGEESYTYVENRIQASPKVHIQDDGIYNDMPLFDHTSAMNAGCSPKWRLLNTITEYNPSSQELENKDILSRHSAALFGYKGDLPVAVAANAREREIAFESFEEYPVSVAVTPEKLSAGNLAVYTNIAPVAADFYKVYKTYEITEAADNVITVDFPYLRASDWNGKTVRITGSNMIRYDDKQVYNQYLISAVAAHATDATKSVITLSSFTNTGIWKGKISVPMDYSSSAPVHSGTTNLAVVATRKHTGKNSLRATGNASFEQFSMELIPGETYVIGAWVSADQENYTYRMLSGTDRRGFTVEFLNASGVPQGTVDIDLNDQNPVIEGWQKIEGSFLFPTTATKLVIHFKSPPGVNTYWDDIRLYPFNGNVQTYVYDLQNYRLSAVLDNNNYASLYYYDAQGNLFLVKKETEKGIQTIQESFSNQKRNSSITE